MDSEDVVPITRTWRAWGSAFNGTQTLKSLDGNNGLLDLTHSTSGGGFGADYQVNPQLLAGFGVGGSTSEFSVPNSETSGRLDGAHAGLYAGGKFSNFYITGALAYAHYDDTTTRLINQVGPQATEFGHFGSDQLSGSFEAGYRKDLGRYAITPFASAAYYDTFQNGYTETGTSALYALTYGARDVSSVPISVGAQVDGRFAIGDMLLQPYLRAFYTHETVKDRAIDANFDTVPMSFFTASGIIADQDTANLRLGARLYITPSVLLYANIEGEASSRSRGYATMGGLSYVPEADFLAKSGVADAKGAPTIAGVPDTPWTASITPELHIDSFQSSRGYPAVNGPYGGGGFQLYVANTIQASGTILPDTQLTLLAKPGFLYGAQSSPGLSGSVATPTDTTASATFTYLAISGVQPFLSLNFNLPSGSTVLKGTAANARLDPDFVTVGTYGEGLNIGPTLGVNLPFNTALTGSLSVGYTHRGQYEQESPIEPSIVVQGTQLYSPGSDATLSANLGYVTGKFNTQGSISYAKEGVTYAAGMPDYQAGDRFIGSLTEAYTWGPALITNFTGTLTYSERNDTLNKSLPAFLAEAFDSNNLVTRLRLDQAFISNNWTYGPLIGFVYRDRNGYDTVNALFVPAKTIVSGGLSASYAFSEKMSAKANFEYFHANEENDPGLNVGSVYTNGVHLGLQGTYAF